MKALKNLSLILLLVLTFTGCHDKSSKLADFNRAVYTPEYASGFDIKGADGKKSVLVTVTNPWQGADSITTYLFIARDGESVPDTDFFLFFPNFGVIPMNSSKLMPGMGRESTER